MASSSLRALAQGSVCPPLKAGTLRLYSMRFCPYAQRTRLMLEHKKIPYETVNVNLRLKPDWFLARNYLGLVPILETDDMVIYESTVCNDYLEQAYPGDQELIPKDPYLKAKDNMLIDTFGHFIAPWYVIARSLGDDKKAVYKLGKWLDRYEVELSRRGNFFGGSGPNNVDFMMWPWFERFSVVQLFSPDVCVNQERHPNLTEWIKRMYEVPAVKATMFGPDMHLAFLQSYAERRWDYDLGL